VDDKTTAFAAAILRRNGGNMQAGMKILRERTS
jgi:hypothetical protein